MDYNNLTKTELIKVIQEQQHALSAVDAKDKEITRLTEHLDTVTNELNLKHATELKKVTDNLVAAHKVIDEKDSIRIVDINQVLFAHGDLLKTLQGVVDTHMKLNSFIIKELSGGNDNG